MSRRVLLLCRQSLTRSDSISLAVQEETMRRFYEARGDTVVGVLSSENTRGWREDRADLSEVVARAKAREFDVLGVYKADRLGRNLRITETVLWELDKAGIKPDSPIDTWIGTPLVRQIMGAINEQFSRDLSRRMTDVVNHKVSEGKHQGPPPFGFVRGGDDRLEPGPDADAARAMFGLRMRGYGRLKIARVLREEYGVRLSPASILRCLANPAYAGGVRGPGSVVVWDAHDGLVDRQTWERVQTLLGSRTRAPRNAAPHWLEGLAWCGCGERMYRAETRPGQVFFRCGNRLNQRPCSNPRHGIKLAHAAAFVVEQFATDLDAIATARVAEVVRRIAATQDSAWPAWQAERARLAKQRGRLLDNRRRQIEMREDGIISREELRERVAEIDGELGRIDAALEGRPEPVDAGQVARAIAAARDAARAVRILAVADPGAFREVLVGWGGRFVLTDPPTLRYAEDVQPIVEAARRLGVQDEIPASQCRRL